MAGEFSARDGLDETMLPAPENVMQKIEVADKYIQSRFLAGDTTLDTEKSQTLTPKIQLKRYYHRVQQSVRTLRTGHDLSQWTIKRT